MTLLTEEESRLIHIEIVVDLSLLFVSMSRFAFEVGVDYEETCREDDKNRHKEEVLHDDSEQLTRANCFFLDEEVVWRLASNAVNPLLTDDSCSQTVSMHLTTALARLDELLRVLQILQIGAFRITFLHRGHVRFHI